MRISDWSSDACASDVAKQPPVPQIHWRTAWRIVPSRFPPVGLFDRVADPDDLAAIAEIEGLTNPRLRDEPGQFALVPRSRRVTAPGPPPILDARSAERRVGNGGVRQCRSRWLPVH